MTEKINRSHLATIEARISIVSDYLDTLPPCDAGIDYLATAKSLMDDALDMLAHIDIQRRELELAMSALYAIANYSPPGPRMLETGYGLCADWLAKHCHYHAHYLALFFEGGGEWGPMAKLRYEVASEALRMLTQPATPAPPAPARDA